MRISTPQRALGKRAPISKIFINATALALITIIMGRDRRLSREEKEDRREARRSSEADPNSQTSPVARPSSHMYLPEEIQIVNASLSRFKRQSHEDDGIVAPSMSRFPITKAIFGSMLATPGIGENVR